MHMRAPDETDFEILQSLLADARRPYSDIADDVGRFKNRIEPSVR